MFTSCLIALLCQPTVDSFEAADFQYAVAPVDNPLKGLVPYRRPADGRFPYSMEFDYVSLASVMTGPNEFNWKPIDDRLEDIASRGRHMVLRVYLEYPDKFDAIPKFLIDGGLKTVRWKNTNTAPFPAKDCVTPDYADPQLIAALESFIAAFGRQYDNDPRLGYVTAGLLGTWGEWHTYPRNDLWASKKTQTAVLKAYESAFSNVPVLLRYPTAGDDLYTSTHEYRFGYHDDSFAWATLETGRSEDAWYFQPSLNRAGLSDAWKQSPIGGEIRPEVWGCIFDDPSCAPAGQEFASCVEALHPTWLLDTGMSREQASEVRLDRATGQVAKMGYEFQVVAASVEIVEGNIVVSTTVQNTGCAPMYHANWSPQVGLFVAGSGPEEPSAAASISSQNLKGILPGQQRTLTATIAHASIDEDRYHVMVTVPSNFAGGRRLRFANAGQDQVREGWLSIGDLKLSR